MPDWKHEFNPGDKNSQLAICPSMIVIRRSLLRHRSVFWCHGGTHDDSCLSVIQKKCRISEAKDHATPSHFNDTLLWWTRSDPGKWLVRSCIIWSALKLSDFFLSGVPNWLSFASQGAVSYSSNIIYTRICSPIDIAVPVGTELTCPHQGEAVGFISFFRKYKKMLVVYMIHWSLTIETNVEQFFVDLQSREALVRHGDHSVIRWCGMQSLHLRARTHDVVWILC
jgi:hypothetical protein